MASGPPDAPDRTPSDALAGRPYARVRSRALLERPDWDVIVIGAGVGGLVCGALLALHGRRVLVLERHWEIGGLSQSFRRGRFRFEVGVHYVGDVGPGQVPGRLFSIVSGGRLRWAPLPREHDRLAVPGETLRFGGTVSDWHAQLARAAPGEEAAIGRVLEATEACSRAAAAYFFDRMGPSRGGDPGARSPFRRFSDLTTEETLTRAGCSARLASLLTYPWPNCGVPPERSCFAAHALSVAHYFRGAFHPVGGGRALGREIARTIHERGGAVVVRAGVSEIALREGRVRGVVLEDGLEVRAPLVVSDAGLRATAALLGEHGAELGAHARAIGPSGAHVGLYVGLDRAPDELGLDGTSWWLGRDGLRMEERTFDAWLAGDAAGGGPVAPGLYVSAACGADPSSGDRMRGLSSLATSLPVSPAAIASLPTDPAENAALKARLGEGMLALLLRYLPGLAPAIVHREVSTPRTTARFTGHASGEIYGLAGTPLRFRTDLRPRVAGVEGCFLTGQDVLASGIAGAASGGLLTASAILGRIPL
jgi:all-trans-retinol 13,14-reductase